MPQGYVDSLYVESYQSQSNDWQCKSQAELKPVFIRDHVVVFNFHVTLMIPLPRVEILLVMEIGLSC